MADELDDEGDGIAWLVELRGVYDGWSVAVMQDGTRVNRWGKNGVAYPGHERQFETVESYLRGEDAEGRWF